MARSMVSIGTDASRALVNMVRRVALELTSPPPSRAATSTCRISLANSFPRALSCAPFLCLMVAHLEWPDIGSHASQKELMQSQVAGDLGVERGDEHPTLPAQHWPGLSRAGLDRRQHLHRVTDPLDHRRPDEHAVDRPSIDAAHREIGLEAVELPAEPVAADTDVDAPDRPLAGPPVGHVASQQDHAGAGAEG